MIVQETWTGIDFGVLLGGVFDGMKPFLPILIPFIVLIIILAVPLPGRGLGFQPRDPWRSFKFEARRPDTRWQPLRGPAVLRMGSVRQTGRGSRPRVYARQGCARRLDGSQEAR